MKLFGKIISKIYPCKYSSLCGNKINKKKGNLLFSLSLSTKDVGLSKRSK